VLFEEHMGRIAVRRYEFVDRVGGRGGMGRVEDGDVGGGAVGVVTTAYTGPSVTQVSSRGMLLWARAGDFPEVA